MVPFLDFFFVGGELTKHHQGLKMIGLVFFSTWQFCNCDLFWDGEFT